MGKAVEKRKKKKGRPSLLDLHRRSLRLQKQQSHSPAAPKPHARATPPEPRTSRRNPNPDVQRRDDDEDDEEACARGKRRERKLKLVLQLHRDGNAGGNPSGSELSGSDSNGERGVAQRKLQIGAIGGRDESGLEADRNNCASKATEPVQVAPPYSGPTSTPLPDEKLLLFVLDRLQRKDTYGVFSEPVDPDELPDYHEVIEHPMDFSTVRKRLSSGYYSNLEMFEEDVFLICSNAMRYNAPDTIYFRQARSIQELAKKNFENLRQESSDDEPVQKTVRRGRPPSKNVTKKAAEIPAVDRANFSSGATLANAAGNTILSKSSHDLAEKAFPFDKLRSIDASLHTNHGLRNNENLKWAGGMADRNGESGSLKGISMKSVRKVSVLDENRRQSYNKLHFATYWRESSFLPSFDGERRHLIPIGIHIEHSYARSLARFAATLGPVGWDIAAKQIEKVLPPGTRFGCGWVGEPDVARQFKTPLECTSSPHLSIQPKTMLSGADPVTEQLESRSASASVDRGHSTQGAPPSPSTIHCRPSTQTEGNQPVGLLNSESSVGVASVSETAGIPSMHPKAPFQHHHKMSVPLEVNGLSCSTSGYDLSQIGNIVRPARPSENFIPGVPITHSQVLDMVSRGDNNMLRPANAAPLDENGTNLGNLATVNSANHLPLSFQVPPHGGSWRELCLRPKQEPTPLPPDQNIRFQSAGSSPTRMVVDGQQQPDLALQL